VRVSTPASAWGRKAADLYEASYAREYRHHDDELDRVAAYEMFCAWLRGVCQSFSAPIDALDLGCGTGRYFCAVSNVRTLVGLDASPAMLAEARRPVHADRITAAQIDLVLGDVMSHDFAPGRFDLVYSIGVLAEHTPLDAHTVSNVHRWLKPGGRFAFTTVHPDSPSVPKTLSRSIGRRFVPLLRGDVRRRLHDRLMSGGLYADETRIRQLLEPAYTIESLTRVRSEAHLHGLCVARAKAA
jgi:SAM-dependent methyltransferase